ncbi:MAG: hypothetical protein WCP97_04420, partial [bacterium]
MRTTSFLASWKIALFIAYRTILRGSKATLGLIIAMITLSLINLLFFSSLMAGMGQSVVDQFKKNVYSNVIIRPESGKRYISAYSTLENVVSQVDGVTATGARVNGQATFRYDPLKNGQNVVEGSFQVTGIDPAQEEQITGVHSSMIAGSYLSSDDRDSIIIGKDMAGSTAGTSTQSNRALSMLLGGGGGGG